MDQDGNKNHGNPYQNLERITGGISQEDGDQPEKGMDTNREPGKREIKVITCRWRSLKKKHDYL
jgi:hypothetical protein